MAILHKERRNPSQGASNPSQVGGNPSQGGGNPLHKDGGNPSQGGRNPSQGASNPSQVGGNPSQGGELSFTRRWQSFTRRWQSFTGILAILRKEVGILHKEVPIPHKEVGGGYFASPKMILFTYIKIYEYLSELLEVFSFWSWRSNSFTLSFVSPKMTLSLTSSYLSICQSYSKFCHFEDCEVFPSHFCESQNEIFTLRLSYISIYPELLEVLSFWSSRSNSYTLKRLFRESQTDIFTYIKLYEYLSELLELFSFWSWGSKSFTLKRLFPESQNDISTYIKLFKYLPELLQVLSFWRLWSISFKFLWVPKSDFHTD